jgi:hypothetical protein
MTARSRPVGGSTYRLRGVPAGERGEPLFRSAHATVKASFSLDAARRGVPLQAVEVPVADDDLVELEFEGGLRLWLRADDYRSEFGPARARGAGDASVLDVPSSLPLPSPAARSRGAVDWALAGLKLVGLDPALAAAQAIAHKLEAGSADDRARRPGPGLYRCSARTGAFALAPASADDLRTKDPVLLLLHGTASSTWGSFGDLWSPERRDALAALRGRYGENLFAFEHPSLTASPLENAADLVRRFPEHGIARLDLVSHSRGGLLGEILCRAGNRAGPPFSPGEVDLFRGRAAGDGDRPPRPEDLRALDELGELLRARRPAVERFVRVACPALGTTLASRRLDRWLSVVGSVVGLAARGTPLRTFFDGLGDFIAAVVKERTRPESLPGLEAMMPDSRVVRLANWPGVTVEGELTVIAGDLEPRALWGRLLVFVTDRFYDGEHDLVVNTASMRGGARREVARQSRHQGANVTHFHYFSNADSSRQLVRALVRAEAEPSGFEPLEPPRPIAREARRRPAEPAPVVFVLPGIMGSELEVDGDRIWLDYSDLVFGGMRKLRIDATGVVPSRPIEKYYEDLIDFLAGSHRVIPFPYDWRLPIEREADRLAAALRVEVGRADLEGMPVRILGHSMGGLVARTMVARHRDAWEQMLRHDGARLVMLGTPNGGSHAITELILGRARTLRQLALLDLKHDREGLLRIVARFPGVLAMLPQDAREDWFDDATWKRYRQAAGGDWILPGAADLGAARAFRQLYDRAPVDASRMVYVAGRAAETPAAIVLERDERSSRERIRLLMTNRGDGRVTWDSGIPAGVPVWYVDAEHGDIPSCRDAFAAFLDLLETGATARLPRDEPVQRGAEDLTRAPFEVEEEFYPDEASLLAGALGGSGRRARAGKPAAAAVDVRVAHGSLSYARHPVLAGHYQGDTIISAEAALDRHLGGALMRRHRFGLYPGPLETSAVFENPDAEGRPSGAIVAGLGPVGKLTPGGLTRSVTKAILNHALSDAEDAARRRRPSGATRDGDQVLGLSSLLVGTAAGGLEPIDAIHAILQGVRLANRALREAGHRRSIGELQFVELWEDRAILAMRTLGVLLRDREIAESFRVAPTIEKLDGGRRRLAYEEPAGWWQRLQILGGEKDDEPLRFNALTRLARAELRVVATQRSLVDAFVAQAIRTTALRPEISTTLFGLLLPSEIRDQAREADHLVLVVDERAASYPWELLENRWGDADRPSATERGLIRQLQTAEFQETVRATTENTALVVGDPRGPFVELKGAQREAEAVAGCLLRDGFSVETRIRADAHSVVEALFARGYRVLHLAGHGVYEHVAHGGAERPRSVTGLVLGDDVFLTPGEVEQMPETPELVFVNCCHLGRIEPGRGTAADGNERRDYNRLAANLATQFIRKGVRAVVAAGWAVDDAAAETFARKFYTEMLHGMTFGDAVRAARKETWERHPVTNTWGAYQCYGDPAYRLVHGRGAAGGDGDAVEIVSKRDAVTQVENLRSMVADQAEGDLSWYRGRLERTERELERLGWIGSAEVGAALARAYGELGDLPRAVELYGAALTAPGGPASLEDFEQWINLRVRLAADRARGDAAVLTAAVAEIDDAIDALWSVLRDLPSGKDRRRAGRASARVKLGTEAAKLADLPGATPERLSLLGSACKRRALIEPEGRRAALARMEACCRAAHELASRTTGTNPYHLVQHLSAEVVRGWFARAASRPNRQHEERVQRQLDEARGALRRSERERSDFWSSAMLAECDLIEALALHRPLDDLADPIAAKLRTARRRGSAREFASVLDQLSFLRAMAVARKGAWLESVVVLLDGIRGRLELDEGAG